MPLRNRRGLQATLQCPMLCGMETKRAIQYAGSVRALAELFGVSRQAVEAWGERLPELRTYQLRQLRPGWFRRKT